MRENGIAIGTPYEHENTLALYKDWYEQYFANFDQGTPIGGIRAFRWAQQIKQFPDERVEKINKRLQDARWTHEDPAFPEYSAFAVRARLEGFFDVYLQDEDQLLVDMFEDITESDIMLAFEGMVLRNRMFSEGFTHYDDDGRHEFHHAADRMDEDDYMSLASLLEKEEVSNLSTLIAEIGEELKDGGLPLYTDKVRGMILIIMHDEDC